MKSRHVASLDRPMSNGKCSKIPTFSGWWFETFFIFPIILGMSSSQLTFTPSFFRGLGLNHQAVLAFQPPDFRCESHRFVEPCVQRGSGASERREEPGGSFQRCQWTDGPKLVFELDE